MGSQGDPALCSDPSDEMMTLGATHEERERDEEAGDGIERASANAIYDKRNDPHLHQSGKIAVPSASYIDRVQPLLSTLEMEAKLHCVHRVRCVCVLSFSARNAYM